MGATKCSEQSAQKGAAALKAASPGGSGLDAILDPVGAGAEAPAVYEALKSDGPRLYSLVILRPGIELPAGLQVTSKSSHETDCLLSLVQDKVSNQVPATTYQVIKKERLDAKYLEN